MRTALIFAALVVLTGSVLSQPGSGLSHTTKDEFEALYKLPALRVSIYGTRLDGEREVDLTLADKGDAEQKKIFESALRPVRMGESFQLTVELVHPNGSTRNVTSDPGVGYFGIGCLLASSSGFITVVDEGVTRSLCDPGSLTTLYVFMNDDNKQTQAWNNVFFRIIK